MATQFEVEGLDNLRRTLRRLGVDVQDFKDAHKKVGAYVTRESSGRAPKRSGRLAASGRPGAAAKNATVRFGGARVPYANAVHWGTGPRRGLRGPHNIRPSRFAVEAAHDTEPTWLPWYLKELESMVDKVKGA